MIYDLATINEQTAREAFAGDHVAILPVGAVEVHGNHLPCTTDVMICTRMARKLAEQLDRNVILMPPVNYGQVWSLRDFPGSMNVSGPVLTAFLADIGRSLYRHGTRTLVLMQGHLGNAPAVKDASRVLYEELGMQVFALGNQGWEQAKDVLTTPRAHPVYIHACEIETSWILYLAPEHVDMRQAVRNYPDFPPAFDVTPSPWSTVTKTAVLGDATAATPEKGKAMVEAAIAHMAALINGAK